MQKDIRLSQMAKQIINYSVALKKGETVYIEGIGLESKALVEEIIKEATKVGAIPYYYFHDEDMLKSFMATATAKQIEEYSKNHLMLMQKADAYVAVRAYDNIYSMSDLSKKQRNLYETIFYKILHFNERIPNTRWCVMRYPNNVMATTAKMSTKAFEDFYFNTCLIDYKKMAKAQEPLRKLMEKTNKVKIISPNTDLEFSIKNIPVIKSCGNHNLPDGEVFTAPVKNSINGYIQFNTQATWAGYIFSNIYLEFKDGKIIKATSDINNDELQDVIKTDAGSCYMGEFAIAHNPFITKEIVDTLFDEKIAGSLHLAIGSSYDDACNTNKSAVHWDLVLIQTKQKGGGEIWFDDKLIRKDGIFTTKELQCLNPDKLK